MTMQAMRAATEDVTVSRWGRRRRAARRLALQDTVSVRLAELHLMRALLEETVVLVNIGWIQNAWFAVTDDQGRQHRLTAHEIHRVGDLPVSGACLVGGIVHAAGGPAAVHSQLVQRTLDLTWHALHEGERGAVRWCPGPDVRAAHLRDLTRWNDHPRRTAGQVSSLLHSAVRVTDHQVDLRRAQQAALV